MIDECDWRLAIGNWQLAIGNWQLAIQSPILNPQSNPKSAIQSPIPNPPSSIQSAICNLQSSIVEQSFNARADPAQQLVGDRANRGRHLAYVDDAAILFADDHDVVARRDIQTRDVHDRHVHAHGSDDGNAAAADEHESVAGEATIEAVRVSRGDDRDRRGAIRNGTQSVARAFAGAHALHVHDTAVE